MRRSPLLLSVLAAIAIAPAHADVVTDWNRTATRIAAEAKLPPPPANRAIAMVQTAVYAATNAITGRYTAATDALQAPQGASLEAAVAAANRTVLLKVMPTQQAAIDDAYAAALATLPDDAARRDGVALGEQAATQVLAARAHDVLPAVEQYRPLTQPGAYVPTALPLAIQWPGRTPWLMRDVRQLRPGPPPALASDAWARDFNEVKAFGGKTSARRTAAQSDMALFWEATMPVIYYGVVQSVADQPGREVTRNARLMMAVAQAMDDGLIAVFDAKYHYNFWRPITAIRNGDQDGRPDTEREPGWVPFVDTPMHPEYPCAHCIVASSMGTVLKAELGTDVVPVLATTSYTFNGGRREWTTVDAFIQEVADARVYDGVHFRTSAEVAIEMGKAIGAMAASRHLTPR